MLFLSIDNAHRPKLRSIDLSNFQKEFLIVLRLVIRIRPRKELIGIVLEMHRDFAEDPASQIDSVIKILRRGENNLGLLEIAGIQIDRAFHVVLEQRRHFLFKLVGLPLDFGQLIRFNKPLKGEKQAIDDVAHFCFVVIGEVERDDVVTDGQSAP